jgi:hypothetical protein
MHGSPMSNDLVRRCIARIALTVLLIVAGSRVAGADPINDNTVTFTANCTAFGDITAVAVLAPSDLARGATSAFHVVGSNTVLLWSTQGTDGLAQQLGTSCTITSIDGVPVDGIVASFAVGNPRQLWDPAVDWRNAPDQANPSPDSYGHADVWSYLASDGFDHNPSQYSPLPAYDPGQEWWYDPSYGNLLIQHGSPTSQSELVFHSYGGRVIDFGRNAILAWTSPINGRITVAGQVRVRDPLECGGLGGGIIWSIDKGAATLTSSAIAGGESSTFKFSTVVREGETLYFVHDPGWDSDCDATYVRLQITNQ